MITALLIAFFSGLLTHYGTSLASKRVSLPGWRSISFYIIRSTFRLPSLLMINNEMRKDIKDPQRLMLVSYVLASCAYGVGIIAAWFLNEDKSKA